MGCEAGDVLTPYGPPETIQALAATPVPPTTGDSWTATGSVAALPASICGHGQSTLPDGRVIVSGGSNDTSGVRAVYMYTPSSNMWEEVATVPIGFFRHGQSVFSDGRVLVSGGSISYPNGINSAYIYTPSNTGIGSWDTIGVAPLPISFYSHGQSTLSDGTGKVLITGGSYNSSNGQIKTAYIYTPNTSIWTTASPMPAITSRHGQSVLTNGSIMISGGWANSVINDSYIYDSSTDKWANAASMIASRYLHAQSTLFDGKVLVSGGSNTGSGTPVFNNSYLYMHNDSEGLWTNASPMPVSVSQHGQSVLADGRVLISGGYNGSAVFSTAYIYTPAGWGVGGAA